VRSSSGRSRYTTDEKLAIVLSVLRGKTTQLDAARALGVSRSTLARWRRRFVNGGRSELAAWEPTRGQARERELRDRVDELTRELAAVDAELDAWRANGPIYRGRPKSPNR
jgi:transposase-like protein